MPTDVILKSEVSPAHLTLAVDIFSYFLLKTFRVLGFSLLLAVIGCALQALTESHFHILNMIKP